jgi:hypothetical protein
MNVETGLALLFGFKDPNVDEVTVPVLSGRPP